MEHTVAIIKSGAVSRGATNEILDMIRKSGLLIRRCDSTHLSRELAETFYADHAGRPYFEDLMASVTGPAGVVTILLKGEDAVRRWRALLGPTNPAVARQQAPGSIRALYGTDGADNAGHGSDSPESAAREGVLLFPTLKQDASASPAP